MEEKIAASNMDVQEQLPLYLAVQCAKGAHEYWMYQIANPIAWAAYLNADATRNYIQVARWVSASMWKNLWAI